MTPERLAEIRGALAARDIEAPSWSLVAEELLEAHEGLRARVLGTATELERRGARANEQAHDASGDEVGTAFAHGERVAFGAAAKRVRELL